MIAYPTPHIAASPGDFAKTVLMPGDPLRAQFIAETYLDNPRLVNNVRGVQGYTGTYRGTPVSVMASGMGMPSIGIYARELYEVYDVQTILRVGSAGALTPAVHLRDIVLGQAACTDSAFAGQFRLPGTFAPIAAYPVLQRCAVIAARQGLPYHVGNLLSSDRFYNDEDDLPPAQRSTALWGKMGVLAVEMEAAALYMTAARLGRQALAICTVSDHIVTGESTTAAERQTSFTAMMQLALETALSLEAEADK